MPEAIERLDRALAIRQARFGEDHPDTAASFIALGLAHHQSGQLDLAEHHLQRGLDLEIALRGGDHPEVANTLHALGGVLLDADRPHDALGAFEEALAIREATFGIEHALVDESVERIAMTLDRLDGHRETLSHEARAGGIRAALDGP